MSIVLFIAFFASIANILSFLWTIVFGPKTLPQVLRDIRSGKPIRYSVGTSSKFGSVFPIVNLLLTACILIILILYVGQPKIITSQPANIATPTTTSPTPTNTSILTPSPTPLDQADWSTSLNGWTGGSEWSVNHGMLVNNGTNQNQDDRNKVSILAPFQLQTANYIVEAEIQYLGKVSSSNITAFGIILRGGKDLMKTGYVCYIYNTTEAKIKIIPDANSQINLSSPLDTSWHKYLVVANNTTISFYLDNKQIGEVMDNSFTSPGMVGLLDNNSQINIRNFQVIPA